MKKNLKIILPNNKFRPSDNEYDVAVLMSKFFMANVEFIATNAHKTPDFLIKNQKWELKTPKGKGKYAIQHQLQRAAKQSINVIIDIRDMEGDEMRIIGEINRQTKIIRGIKRILVVRKNRQVEIVK